MNDAVFHVPEPNLCYTGDFRWLQRNGARAVLYSTVYAAIDERHGIFGAVEGVTHLKRLRDAGASRDRQQIHIGGCSGYGALQIAALSGATRIALLGFDLTPGRFMDSDQPEETERYHTWAQQFDQLAIDLAQMGVTVVNCSKTSLITAFQRADWQEVEDNGLHIFG